MQTCEDQRKCISWSITEDSDGSTCAGDCDMTVCLTIDLSLGGCSKDGAISHTCVKGTDQCTGTGGFGGGGGGVGKVDELRFGFRSSSDAQVSPHAALLAFLRRRVG